MRKPKCALCGNGDIFIIEGRIFIDGLGNYQYEAWDYEHGSPLRCGKCVEPISPDEIPDDFRVKGGPLDNCLVFKLGDDPQNEYVEELMAKWDQLIKE